MTAAQRTASAPDLVADPAEVERAIALLLPPGGVIECRIPNTEREGTVAGWFNDPAALKREILGQNGRIGIYGTLNPVHPSLLDRYPNRVNRLEAHVKETTRDEHILRRLRVLLDFDSVRPAQTSATDQEHEAALERMRTATAELIRTYSWPQPMRAAPAMAATRRTPSICPTTQNRRGW